MTVNNTERIGFIDWMIKIQSVHFANKPAMERALTRLSDNDFFNLKHK